jgi:hypothetical protein
MSDRPYPSDRPFLHEPFLDPIIASYYILSSDHLAEWAETFAVAIDHERTSDISLIANPRLVIRSASFSEPLIIDISTHRFVPSRNATIRALLDMLTNDLRQVVPDATVELDYVPLIRFM